MEKTVEQAHLQVDQRVLERDFDRVPFGFSHELNQLDLLSFDSLRSLATKYDREFFVASSASTPAAKFYSVSHGAYSPVEALERLDTISQRVLLKRPEMYDERFADLLRDIFKQVVDLRGGLGGERIVRLMSSILVSSAETITPFHFDPEISFFFQIEGEKIYHLYEPTVLTEAELERFYTMGIVDIGQVDLGGRDPAAEHVFELAGGNGMHQPQNCPHWVETRGTRSISYVVSFETDAGRALGRTRAFNYYLRSLGFKPAYPGTRLGLDGQKAAAMRLLIPLRKRVAKTLRDALRGRMPNVPLIKAHSRDLSHERHAVT